MNDNKLAIKTVQLYGAAMQVVRRRVTLNDRSQSEHGHRADHVDAYQTTMMKYLNRTFSFFCMCITQLRIFNTSDTLL